MIYYINKHFQERILKLILSLSLFCFVFFAKGQTDTIYISYSNEVKEFFSLATSKALSQGILTKELKRKQPATIKFNSLIANARIRLKGDWTDHIKKDKWSFRVELERGNLYYVRKFSLQFPETRGGENESVFHEVLASEGILTTDYRFVHFVVNEKYWGVFAFEEHFDELLIENNKRISGPILKFDEEGFWECQMMTKIQGENKCYEYPVFDAARVKVFNKKKILKDSVSQILFLKSRSILEQWQRGEVNKENIDLDKFARYYALCDVFQFYHGLQWHNQRFYYRKIDNKLEPVAYDCYSKNNKLIGKSFLGLFDEHYQTIYFNEQWFNYQLFQIKEFKENYYYWLDFYKDKKWKLSRNQVTDPIQNRLNERAIDIERFLKVDQLTPKYYSYKQWKIDHPNEVKKYETAFSTIPLTHVGGRAKLKGKNIKFENFDVNSVSVIGFGEKEELIEGVENIEVESKSTAILKPNKKYTYLFYKSIGNDTLSCIIEAPDLKEEKVVWKKEKLLTDSIGNFVIENRTFKIDSVLIIPKGKTLVIKNSNIDFITGGQILSYGNVRIENSKLFSSDEQGKGVVVLFADLHIQKSIVSSFNTNKVNSPLICSDGKVIINNLLLKGINANDAINLNNCQFQVNSIEVVNCEGDGLDIDFGEGDIINSKFHNCKGDGIDLSGAKVKILNVDIQKCLDKGISIGERSRVDLRNTSIKKCTLGIGVKDESFLTKEKVTIKQCIKETHCFIKKDYYNYSGKIN